MDEKVLARFEGQMRIWWAQFAFNAFVWLALALCAVAIFGTMAEVARLREAVAEEGR